ncbi:MAG: tetratricopeptide repeat protein [Deltaproteobacteria bacterium]|nr:tetratricopeptide repeat protein [Deltaproteobacteria bacterium]
MGKAKWKKLKQVSHINAPATDLKSKYIFMIIIAMLSLAAFQRNAVWTYWADLWSNVIKNSPERGRGYVNLGIEYENSDIDRAFEIYKQALTAAKDNFYVHFRLAQIYEKKGLDDLAIKEYEEALDPAKIYDAPRSSYADVYLGFALLLQKKGLVEKAIMNYQKAVEISPNSLTAYKAHNNIGAIYGEQNFFDMAVKEFKQAIEIDPILPDAYNNLAVEYAKKELYEDALSSFQTALKLNPNDAITIQNIAAAKKNIKNK